MSKGVNPMQPLISDTSPTHTQTNKINNKYLDVNKHIQTRTDMTDIALKLCVELYLSRPCAILQNGGFLENIYRKLNAKPNQNGEYSVREEAGGCLVFNLFSSGYSNLTTTIHPCTNEPVSFKSFNTINATLLEPKPFF